MLTIHPRDARILVAERARSLRDEVAADRLGGSGTRTFFAASLRRAAERLDPAPVVPSAA